MFRKLLAVTVVALSGGVVGAADLKSGPQVGAKVPGPFHPLNVNGKDAGKKACLYCENLYNPVAAVFARDPADPALLKLIAALDAVTAKNEAAEMGSFVVYLSADDTLAAKLKEQADKAGYKKIVLSVDTADGPAKYDIAKDAAVTVLLYKELKVVANFTFEKGKLTEQDVAKIVADVSKITK